MATLASLALLLNCGGGGLANNCEQTVHLLPVDLPVIGQNNVWFRASETRSTVIVFVHGIFSDSRSCWLAQHRDDPSRDRYWPDLLRGDHQFDSADIYLAGYGTAVDSGRYETSHAVIDELWPALVRHHDGHRAVMDYDNVVFIAHSTGGVVTRYLLDMHREAFAAKRVKLILLASPSQGAYLEDYLEWLADAYGNDLARQLGEQSDFLRDLDVRFRQLVEDKVIPGLSGVEACEQHFIFHRRWLPDRLKVVDERAMGRYFGNARMMRGTDHWSIAKPECDTHPSYVLVSDTFGAFIAAKPNDKDVDTASGPKRVIRIAIVLNGDVFYTRESMGAFTQTLDELLSPTNYAPLYEYVVGSPKASEDNVNKERFSDVLSRFPSVDYLVTVGTNVSEFAWREYREKLPLVFLAVTDPIRSGIVSTLGPDESRGNIAGVTYGVPAADYIGFIDKLLHGQRVGFVLNGEYHQDLAFVEELERQLAHAGSPFQLVRLTVNEPKLTPEQLSSVDALFGRYFFMSQLQKFMTCGKPIIAADSSNAKKGAVATFSTDSSQIGEIAAREIIYKNLTQGTALRSIAIQTPTRVEVGVNLGAARRFGIKLPQELVRKANVRVE